MDKGISLQEVGNAWFSLFKDQAKLFMLECELAQSSILPMLFSGVALVLLSISFWLLTLICVGYGIYTWQNDVWISLASVFIFNLLAMCFAYASVRRHRNRMNLKHTRDNIKEVLS